MAVAAGADAIGLNFVSSSPRYLDLPSARAITGVAKGRAATVGVFADAELNEMLDLRTQIGLDLLQLHGSETPQQLEALGSFAYKALRIASPADVSQADSYSGDRILVDSRVAGVAGGTGQTFDWSLAVELAARRPLVLAGGLTPDNLGAAIRQVRPWGVDTASGVESAPGVKDPALTAAFVRVARDAAQGLSGGAGPSRAGNRGAD